MEVGGQLHAPAALPLGRRLGTHFIGGWIGPSFGLAGCGKTSPTLGLDQRNVQHEASGHIGYGIPVYLYVCSSCFCVHNLKAFGCHSLELYVGLC